MYITIILSFQKLLFINYKNEDSKFSSINAENSTRSNINETKSTLSKLHYSVIQPLISKNKTLESAIILKILSRNFSKLYTVISKTKSLKLVVSTITKIANPISLHRYREFAA